MISIITPSHNRAHIIGETIESVLNQTYQDFEYIIVDDSEDETELVVCKYPQVKYVRVEVSGPNLKRKQGASIAKGEYLVFLDDDDILYPNFLEVNLKKLDESYKFWTYTEFDILDEIGLNIEEESIYNRRPFNLQDFKKNPRICDKGLFVKEIYDRIGGHDESLEHFTDVDLTMNYISKGYYPLYIPQRLLQYRIHEKQLCNLITPEERQRDWSQLQNKYKDFWIV